jgi:hypothetical protein
VVHETQTQQAAVVVREQPVLPEFQELAATVALALPPTSRAHPRPTRVVVVVREELTTAQVVLAVAQTLTRQPD